MVPSVGKSSTQLVKKIIESGQDIRLHRKEFVGGYSARVFDTKYITPFLKKRFPRIAMKESGWLSRSIEQPYPFTLDFPGKVRDGRVKQCFLHILNDIEENNAATENYLLALFTLLIQKFTEIRSILEGMTFPKEILVDLITDCLKLHFFHKYSSAGASKLPVIAIYSLYQLMMEDITRYRNKTLNLLFKWKLMTNYNCMKRLMDVVKDFMVFLLQSQQMHMMLRRCEM